MHSCTYGALIALKLVYFRFDSILQKSIPTFNDQDIEVDDREPRNQLVELVAKEMLLT